MKNINKILNIKWLLIVPILLLLNSCTKDLEIVPKDDDDFTSEAFYKQPGAYKQFLAKIYGGLAVTGQKGPAGDSDLGSGAGTVDEGFSQYLRGYWQLQELTTDEAIIAWGESDNPTIKNLNFNNWNADNVFVEAFFARVFFQIGLANEFLRETTDAKLDGRNVDAALRTEIKRYRAEVRFLRALSYYHGIDIFGKIPFGTDADLLGTPPQMQTRTFVFNYILDELSAIDGDLAAPKTNEYARADQAAAWMLKAKLLLNASVYTGTDRGTDALAAVNQVIGSGYSILTTNRNRLFLADNNLNGAQNEIIFPIAFDGVNTKTYGGTTFLINAASTTPTANALGITSNAGWSGFRVRKEFTTTVGTDSRITYVPLNTDVPFISDYTIFAQGAKLIKFSNKTTAGANGSNTSFPDTDFPLFRMGDAYLMYAELAANGFGSKTTAVGYVNALRTRSNTSAPLIAVSDLTPQLVLDERAKELYWEGHRRQDLIRFGQYLSTYNWQWKGGTQNGGPLDSYRLVFPIPNKELQSNSNLSQNTGY
jgi:starch-binding outer membrane protein, SusD/RagB family